MRICLWVSKIFELGGTKKIVTLLANELAKNHDVSILTSESRKAEMRNMYNLSENVKVIFYESREFSRGITSFTKYKNRVVKFINNRTGFFNAPSRSNILLNALYPKKRRDNFTQYLNEMNFDVIIAASTLALFLASIAPNLNAKTIGWQHSSYSAYTTTKGMYFWHKEILIKELFPNLFRYVVLSKYDVDDYRKKLGIETIDINNPITVTSDKTSDLTKKNFLIAARFEPVKGVDMALEAFVAFAQRNDEWNLIVAGDGTQREELVEYVWQNNLVQRVRFIGTVTDMPKYYLESSIYLMTSRWEGWGLVVTEAFSMGLPVIAFDIPPMDIIIDNEINGLIVPLKQKSESPFSTKAYSRAMLKLANDDDLRKKMGQAAYKKSKQYSMENYIAKWTQLISE